MRIVTWNCRADWSSKKHHIYDLNPDIAVIQECSKTAAYASEADRFSVVWDGSDAARGVAVLARGKWAVSALEKHRYKLLVPVKVAGPTPFLMIAVWTQAMKSVNEKYVAQAHRAVEERAEWFDGRDVVFSGDFNSNVFWDRKGRLYSHSGMVTEFDKRQMHSAYHASRKEPHGSESAHTFYQYTHEAKPYHIDYTFVPKHWLIKDVTVGDYEFWCGRGDHATSKSDHVPLITDCEPRALQPC